MDDYELKLEKNNSLSVLQIMTLLQTLKGNHSEHISRFYYKSEYIFGG